MTLDLKPSACDLDDILFYLVIANLKQELPSWNSTGQGMKLSCHWTSGYKAVTLLQPSAAAKRVYLLLLNPNWK